jgi:uncharacterized membrane protein
VRTATLRSVVYLSGVLGLLVALFAAAEFYTASLRSVCSINQFFSCATVDRSGLTSTLGVPDYAWGIAGFVALLAVAGLAEKRARDPRPAYALVVLATGAVALSGYFLYVQLGRIHALCVVCATAEAFGAILWVASIALARRTARSGDDDEDDAPDASAAGPDPGPE